MVAWAAIQLVRDGAGLPSVYEAGVAEEKAWRAVGDAEHDLNRHDV